MIKRLLALVIILVCFNGFGQVASYTFTETNTTPILITGNVAIANGWDDASTGNTIPIGFTFNFNGTNYTTCSVNSNGYITFGANTSGGGNYNPISSGDGYDGAISGFSLDLIDDNGRDILYETSGIAPNRVFTVQWRQARRYWAGGRFNFQIKLFETTNVIQVIYDNFGLNNTNLPAQVGLRGATNADFNNRSLTAINTAWDNNTTAGGFNIDTCRSRNNNEPSNGRTFIWTPTSCYSPTNPIVNIISVSNANLSWTAPSNVPSNGYEWEIRTSGVAGSGAAGLTDSGSSAAGVINDVTTSLTADTNYTLYVRSNCGGGDYSSWDSITFYTGYCTPISEQPQWVYIDDVRFMGTLNDVDNLNSGFSNGY